MKKLLAIVFSVVILATFMAVPAFAAESPEGELVFKVDVESFSSGTSSKGNYVVEGDTIRLTISEDSDYDFTGWVIEGKYEIVSGSLDSKELVIRPLSDVSIVESYDVETAPDGDKNDSDKAPQTGNTALVLLSVITAGAFVAMVSTRKAVKA